MTTSNNNMIIHLVAGGVAGTTGAILTSPLEVVKVRFQADQKSLRRLNVCSNTTSSASTSHHHNATTTTTASNTSTSTSRHVHSNNATKSVSHHHARSNTKSRIKSYVNILFRNNHGGAATQTSGHYIPNGINFELNHNQSHFNSSPFQSFVDRRSYAQAQIGRNIVYKFRAIIENEGFRALFKGLGPNIVGVAPYRAIYFFSYANSKNLLLKYFGQEGPILHIGSAFIAGFAAVTITNPIWFIKTRLQVDETRRGTSALEIINKILREKGPLGFYKGISASYFGITESALYFVIYEKLKSMSSVNNDCKDGLPLSCYLTSAGFSKTLASCICYPHEVARTRLRLEGNKYRGFFQTLNLIIIEEGVRGMYKGMATHMIRQIPNTAIVMTTYELIINYWKASSKTCPLIDHQDGE